MLSANAIMLAAGVVMFGLVVLGRARDLSWPTIIVRCALICAVVLILAVTLFPLPIDARLWKFHRAFSNLQRSERSSSSVSGIRRHARSSGTSRCSSLSGYSFRPLRGRADGCG